MVRMGSGPGQQPLSAGPVRRTRPPQPERFEAEVGIWFSRRSRDLRSADLLRGETVRGQRGWDGLRPRFGHRVPVVDVQGIRDGEDGNFHWRSWNRGILRRYEWQRVCLES